MSATPQDVQAKLDQAVAALEKTTSSFTQMVKYYGTDWTKWPTGTNWYQALNEIKLARAEVGQLMAKVLTADFTAKEV